jgi:hypothetical protein
MNNNPEDVFPPTMDLNEDPSVEGNENVPPEVEDAEESDDEFGSVPSVDENEDEVPPMSNSKPLR